MKLDKILSTEYAVAVIGIICVCILEVVALMKGIDGVTFGAAASCVGCIVGYTLKSCDKLCK